MTYPSNQYPQGSGGKRNVVGPVLVVVIAALVGLGVLGFVTPGFFLGDDKDSSASSDDSTGGTSGTSASDTSGTEETPEDDEPGQAGPTSGAADPTADPTADPAAYLTGFLDAVHDRDLGKIRDLSCGELDGNQSSLRDLLDDGTPAPLSLVDPDALRVTSSTIDGSFEGVEEERGPITGLVGARLVDEKWCVDTFSWARA